MYKTVTLALTGASGLAYGLRLLECLLAQGAQVRLLVSQAAHVVAAQELQLTLPARPAELESWLRERYPNCRGSLSVYGREDWFAPVSSGSGASDAMVVCPCSMGTLAATTVESTMVPPYRTTTAPSACLATFPVSRDRTPSCTGISTECFIRAPDIPRTRDVPDYNESRARREAALADMAELEVAERRGALVPVDEACAEVQERYTLVRTRLLGVPWRVAQRLPHMAGEIVPVLDELLREALEVLAIDEHAQDGTHG